MPTLRRSKPVRRVRQDPLPNAVQLPPPTDFSFSYRRGRDLAETARANTNSGGADKADESKPAHDKFLSWRHSNMPLKGRLIDRTDSSTKSQRPGLVRTSTGVGLLLRLGIPKQLTRQLCCPTAASDSLRPGQCSLRVKLAKRHQDDLLSDRDARDEGRWSA